MDLRSQGRKLSFDILTAQNNHDSDDILYRSNSDPFGDKNAAEGISLSHDRRHRRKRKKRASKKKKMNGFLILEDPISEAGSNIVLDIKDQMCFDKSYSSISLDSNCQTCCVQTAMCEEKTAVEERETLATVLQITETQPRNSYGVNELRQRNINGGIEGDEDESRIGGDAEVERSVEPSSSGNAPKGVECRKLETAESLDWKQLMEDYSSNVFFVEKSPLKYFMDEMYAGNSLRSTTNPGDEKERERVYDTLFRLPWRCELLIDVGFLLCLDSFLSLLTIMPTRIMMAVWGLVNKRKFKRPSAAELCDFGCFIVLACGVTMLEQTDISLIYHMIRGQGTIKLYVVYNVLEIFDKLFQNLCGDVMQTLFNSAEGFASCPYESLWFWLWRLISDQALAVVALILHSFTLLAQAITLSTCIVARNNALLALLVSTNFAEIKSSVFKRFNKENIQSLVYFDSVERFHISASLLFVLSQNILEAEGPWLQSFCLNALLVFISEMAIDIIKHSFLAKFNNIKPITYSEFLEDLCKQTLNMEIESGKKNLTFVPLAPACVVIRALSPIYSAHLPYGPAVWRVLWICFLGAVTFMMLSSLKVLVGMILRKHAIWYIQRCQMRRHHLHYD